MKMKRTFLLFLACLFLSASAQNKVVIKNPVEINVMTINVRYANSGDGVNSWEHRKERVANTILSHGVDILGTQELLFHSQLTYLESALPDYKSIGVGRKDGKEKGEYSAIFYNSTKFTELSSGHFWLSENPDAVGVKGWDAAYERIATWARLKEKTSGKIIFVLNTHLDHIGKIARRESVKLIQNKIKLYSKKLPVIVTGDFNANPESEVIKNMTDKHNPLHLNDSRALSPVVNGPAWSFHDFGRIPPEKRELIDYIFLKNKINVLQYEVIDGTQNDNFISDHNPVWIKVQF